LSQLRERVPAVNLAVSNIKTKAEAAKKLALNREDFVIQSSKLNCRKMIPILLCLDDAVSNLEKTVLTAHKVQNQFGEAPELYVSFFQFIQQWYRAIDKMIKSMLENGFDDPTTKIDLPKLDFGIYINNEEQEKFYREEDFRQHLREMQKQGKIQKNPWILFVREADFLGGKAPGFFYLNINPDASKHVIAGMNLAIKLRDLFVQQEWLNSMIYEFPAGTEIEFDEMGSKRVSYPANFNLESTGEDGLTMRFLEATSTIPEWNSRIREISTINLKNESLRGAQNLCGLKAEWLELNKAYFGIRGFQEVFRKKYGLTLEIFSGIIVELLCMCYNEKDHAIGIWSVSDLIGNKELTKNFSPENVKSVIEILSTDKKRKTETLFILRLGDLILTNFRRLSVAQVAFPEYCFGEFYENGLKGPVFEEACRKLLREKGFQTLPSNVKIDEPMVPLEVALTLWRKQKQNTDLDVIAALGNIIILIECKEIKAITPNCMRQINLQNTLKKCIGGLNGYQITLKS